MVPFLLLLDVAFMCVCMFVQGSLLLLSLVLLKILLLVSKAHDCLTGR